MTILKKQQQPPVELFGLALTACMVPLLSGALHRPVMGQCGHVHTPLAVPEYAGTRALLSKSRPYHAPRTLTER